VKHNTYHTPNICARTTRNALRPRAGIIPTYTFICAHNDDPDTVSFYDADGNNWAILNASGSLISRNLYSDAVDGLFASVSASGSDSWYYLDHLGSVRAIANSSGSVTDQITYGSTGNIASQTGSSNGDPYLWEQGFTDAITGMMLFQNRWYDPDSSRWIQQDPTGFDGGDSNLYRSFGNDPVNETDPTGLAGGQPQLYRMTPPPPPPGLKIFRGEEAAAPAPGPTGWSVINALALSIISNALQMKAINEWAVEDDRYHNSDLTPLDPSTLPKNDLLRNALQNPNAASLQTLENGLGKALNGACQTSAGTQALIWENTKTQTFHTGKFDPDVDRLMFAFAHLDNSRIGRATSGGSPTTRRSTQWCRSIGGNRNDNAGHAIGFQLGGSGRKEDGNLFPQNPSANQAQRNIENNIATFAKNNLKGCVTILVAVNYKDIPGQPLSRRPMFVSYCSALTDNAGNVTPNTFVIPNPPK